MAPASGPLAAHDLRHEALAALRHAPAGLQEGRDVGRRHGGRLGQLQDLQGAGPMGQAAQEAALLQPGDQAVDAGLGLEPQRLLHLVEGRRHATLVEALVDEHQQFVLLAG